MCDIWSKLEFVDDECNEVRKALSSTELARLTRLAEYPELENPVLEGLPEAEDSTGWGR